MVDFEEGGKWDYTDIRGPEHCKNEGKITQAEAAYAKLVKEIGLNNNQATVIMKWSNDRIRFVMFYYVLL